MPDLRNPARVAADQSWLDRAQFNPCLSDTFLVDAPEQQNNQ